MANMVQNEDTRKKEYNENGYSGNEEQGSGFDLRVIWYLILRYKYFLLVSILICMGLAYAYLKYNTVDVYSTYAKMLIKDPERKTYYASNSIISTLSDMGRRNFSNGFDNELRLESRQTVRCATRIEAQHIAVAQDGAYRVVAFAEERGDIVSVVVDGLCVVGLKCAEDISGDGLSVDESLSPAHATDV